MKTPEEIKKGLEYCVAGSLLFAVNARTKGNSARLVSYWPTLSPTFVSSKSRSRSGSV